MLFRVLGDVAVVDDDGEVTSIAAQKQRALLALLSLNANRVIGRSVIVDSLWGESLPEVPAAALHVVVSRLRRALGAHGRRVVAENGGYRLDAGPEEVDLLRAEALLRDGRAALGGNEAKRAAVALERALSLWTGEALEDLADVPFSGDASRRLRELRLAVIEARNDAYLMDGRHLEVLADIHTFVVAEPLRERLRGQQVVALYQAGRQAEALRAMEALRKTLHDELGLDPSTAMRQLERRVLDQDRSLLASDSGFMTPIPAWTAEALPFVGRIAELDQTLACLARAAQGGMRFVLVEGDAGIGKSRFLLQLARRVARGAIVLPIHVHEMFSPALHAFARVIAEATLRISDEELQVIVEALPGVPNDIPQVRAVASALVAGKPLNDLMHDEDLLQGTARWIAALSMKAPVVILLDDLDSAGASLLHVIGQLASSSIAKRVLVVGTARRLVNQTSPSLERLMMVFERLGLVDRISLPTFDAGDINQLLKQMHVGPRIELVGHLQEMTAGSPFLLAEMLSISPPERATEQWPLPPQVRDVVRQRTAELGRATAELLTYASLFEHDFTIEVLADVVGSSPATVSTLVDRAVGAHVLQPSTICTYAFCHQLFRQTLVGDLSPSELADRHRRVACALERVEASPARLAAHWAGALGPDVPAKVVSYSPAAGRESMRMFEPSAAAKWFETALAQLTNDRDRGPLLAEIAEAQQYAGDSRFSATLAEAVRIALAVEDDELTLQLVRMPSPGWSTLPGVTGPDTRQLLARAWELADDDATRSRILARMAVDLSLRDPATAERDADDAVTLARGSGDRKALLESLLRRASISLSPHSLAQRRCALQEMFDAGARSADVVTHYFALSASVVVAIQAGDVREAERLSGEADALTVQYDIAPLRWSSMVRRAWRTGLAGRLEHADRLIEDAHEFGNDSGISHATETALMQRGLLRWQQHRVAQTVPFARAAFDDFGTTFPNVALVLARALAEDETGHDEARALLRAFGEARFEEWHPGTFWSSVLVLTAETACILDLPELSSIIRDQLMPFADQVAFTGAWVTAPIAYGVGIAMAGCRDPRAGRMLEHAAGIADRMNASVLATRAREHQLVSRCSTASR